MNQSLLRLLLLLTFRKSFLSDTVHGLSMSTIAATLDNYTMPIGLSPTLQRPTLVLNRNWQPIKRGRRFARALIMLWNDSAKIVDPIDYQLYDWSDWSRLVPDRDEPFIQSVRSAHSYPRGHCN